MKFIAEYDYFIFFQNIKHSSQNLFYNLVSLEKIIYVDEICKKVLIPPFDYTIDDILCNLDYTFSYIFGQTNNKVRDKDADGCIIQILKILKYLKLNIVCNFKIFNSILEKKNNMLRVVSFNVFSSIQDLKKNETLRQISHLKYIDADILFLQECSEEIQTKLLDYDYLYTPSHCGHTYLLIKKKLNPIINEYVCQDGIIISWISTIIGDFILGSLHMIPYEDKEEITFRIEQMDFIQTWIIANKLNEGKDSLYQWRQVFLIGKLRSATWCRFPH
jgi:hypothetical protein